MSPSAVNDCQKMTKRTANAVLGDKEAYRHTCGMVFLNGLRRVNGLLVLPHSVHHTSGVEVAIYPLMW